MTSIGAQKLIGKLEGLFIADGEGFVSRPVDQIELDFNGIIGDHHHGLTRKSGGREPWYKRGTEMRNERHISILSQEELAEIGDALNLDELDVGRIGANFVTKDIPNLSRVPSRTLFFFPSGAVVRIDGYNAPCKISGKSLQDAQEGRDDIEFGFVKAAKTTRGIVGWVERPGIINVGDEIKVRVWPQELYVV
ncbi:MOSC domain-containing protein [Maritalea sp.]|uniref:MOSC domain-containing protein n=1 Tax=Maritalea sp. TaxID=2003361 RepID=UPI003EF70A8C